MSMLAAGVSAVGSILGGIGKRRAAKARARAMGRAAHQARQEAGIAAQIQLEESDRVGARAAVQAAASGGGGLQGSALDVLDDLARQGMYRARQTVRDGIAQSIAIMNDAKVVRQQGSLDLWTGIFQGTSTFLSSAAEKHFQRSGGG